MTPRSRRTIAGAEVDVEALFRPRVEAGGESFGEALDRYRARIPRPSGWWDEVSRIDVEAVVRFLVGVAPPRVRDQCRPRRAVECGADVPEPRVIFCLPTRARTCTSRAVEALHAEIDAFTIVFHNYAAEPAPAVVADLDKLRARPDVLVIDRAVDWNIGEIRAFVTDVALHAAWRSGARPLIASADSDITRVFADSYRRAIRAFEDPAVDATTHRRYVELSGLEPDVNLLLLGLVDNLRAHVRSRYVGAPCNTVGAATVFRPTALCQAGGYPSVAVGEDLLMQDAFAWLRGQGGSVRTIQENGVVVDHRAQYSNVDRHYEEWPRGVDVPSIAENPHLADNAKTLLASWIGRIFHEAIAVAAARGDTATQAVLLTQAERTLRHFLQLATKLPSLPPPERLLAAHQADLSPR